MHRIIESSHAPHRSLRNNSNYWYASFVATSPLALSGASSSFFISPRLLSFPLCPLLLNHTLILSFSLFLSFFLSLPSTALHFYKDRVRLFVSPCLLGCLSPLERGKRHSMRADAEGQLREPAHIVGPRLKISTGWAVPFLSLSLSPLSLSLQSLATRHLPASLHPRTHAFSRIDAARIHAAIRTRRLGQVGLANCTQMSGETITL